jgi:serine/threonine protein kinase HipA of HipAB toxin-antitoxin module
MSPLAVACLLSFVVTSVVVPRADAQAPAHVASPMAASAERPNPFAGVALTETQRGSLRSLTTTTRDHQRAILARQRAGTPMSAADRAELTRLALEHNAALAAMLSDAQRARYLANMERLQAAHRQRYDSLQRARVARVVPAGRGTR